MSIIIKTRKFIALIMLCCIMACNEKSEEMINETEYLQLEDEMDPDFISEEDVEDIRPVFDNSLSESQVSFKDVATKSGASSYDALTNTLFDLGDTPVNILIKSNSEGRYLTAKRKRYKKMFKYHYSSSPAIFTTAQDDNGKTTMQTFYLTYFPLSGTYGIKTVFKGEDHYLVPGVKDSEPDNYFLFASSDDLTFLNTFSFRPTDDGYYCLESQLSGSDDPDNPTTTNVWSYVLESSKSETHLAKNCKSDQQKFQIVPKEDFEVVKIEYHNDATAVLTQLPDFVVTWTAINNTSVAQQVSTNFGSTATITSNFSNTVGVSLSVSASFDVGVPVVANGKISVSETSSRSRTWGKSETSSDSRNYNFPVTVPPYRRLIAKAQVMTYKMNVGYTTYLRGLTTGREVRLDGVWEGVDCTDITTSYTEYELETGKATRTVTMKGVPGETRY